MATVLSFPAPEIIRTLASARFHAPVRPNDAENGGGMIVNLLRYRSSCALGAHAGDQFEPERGME